MLQKKTLLGISVPFLILISSFMEGVDAPTTEENAVGISEAHKPCSNGANSSLKISIP